MLGRYSLLGFTKVSIVLCGRSYPRILLCLLNLTVLIETIQMLNEWSIQSDRYFSTSC